jgi:hypothetical protein
VVILTILLILLILRRAPELRQYDGRNDQRRPWRPRNADPGE